MNRTLEVQLTCVAKQVREKVICHSWWKYSCKEYAPTCFFEAVRVGRTANSGRKKCEVWNSRLQRRKASSHATADGLATRNVAIGQELSKRICMRAARTGSKA